MEKNKIMLYGYKSLDSLHKKKETYINIAKYAETRFDTLDYELEKQLPSGKNKKSYCLNESSIR